jgi:hypothetical protein
MKNTFGLICALTILLISILGCSSYNPLAGRTDETANNANTAKTADNSVVDSTIESTVGGTTTGVVECDELLNSISDQSKNQNDDYVSKATREFFLNRIRDSVKKSLEENKSDKVQMAKNCADFKKQLDKFKAEEDSKKAEGK